MTNEVGRNHGNVVQASQVGSIHLTTPESLPTALNGLRNASESFIGRESELAELDGAGLTVVSGLAGVGKTELVLRYAETFPGGKLFVDLQDYDDERRVTPAQALEEFLTALGVRDVPQAEAARASLFRTITAECDPMLIVIDNARSAQNVRPLLPNRHRTIVTSRHRLVGLDDAHHLELGLLSPEEATALVGDEELAELCGRLPLALRIMAALRRTDPGHDWVAELREVKLDLLDDGDERSVRAAFALSYRALTEEQRRVFRLSALHPSHEVTIEGAAQLARCTEAKARKALRELRTAHLLEPGDRFHDLVRQFAADCVREDEEQDTREQAMTRLINHFTMQAISAKLKLDTPTVEALAWFDQHRPTLVAMVLPALLLRRFADALMLAWAMHDYLADRGHHDEQRLMAQLAIDAAHNMGRPWIFRKAQEKFGAAWNVVSSSHDLPPMNADEPAHMTMVFRRLNRCDAAEHHVTDDPR